MTHREGLARQRAACHDGGEQILLLHTAEEEADGALGIRKRAERVLIVDIVDLHFGVRLCVIVKELLERADRLNVGRGEREGNLTAAHDGGELRGGKRCVTVLLAIGAEGGNEIAVVELIPGESYRRARSDETGVSIVVKDGKVRVVGFDNGTYYLKETVVPGGYTGLSARKEFIIADASLDAVFNADIYSTGSGVHVVNRKGNMLPETGGMGTVLFVTFGMLTVLGTGVLLVTKKRMAMIED